MHSKPRVKRADYGYAVLFDGVHLTFRTWERAIMYAARITKAVK
ncbi:hypothetical protein BcepSauron_004 [Burkholderia phage BcepSauron]|uniref:Uncharacterized protein n=1 Tax=Burkholderia phage BcepSauron TaxID=2530033 RepID=A0A482MKT6_9CAUD|nr:hypothetical protein H1O17_gp004 [Burkholderia phage BcepSauron]QBQ74384.1 hypothetical protein BcepSauron_004 [Burkholderia phage BcepSauron]